MNPEPAAGEGRATPDGLTHLLDESFSGEATVPAANEPSSQETTAEIANLRAQIDELAQKLVGLPDQLTDKIVAAVLADREETIGWVTGESHRLHDQLTALIRGEIANRASGQHELEKRLAARHDEETQSLLDELGGAIRETTATLGTQQQASERRSAERQVEASNQLVEKLSLGLLSPLSEIREETRRLNEQLEGAILERIDTIAEEYRQFRARLAAAARIAEGRFEEAIKRLEDSLSAIENQLDRLGPPTRKAASPATKKSARPKPAKRAARSTAAKAKAKAKSAPTTAKRTRR